MQFYLLNGRLQRIERPGYEIAKAAKILHRQSKNSHFLRFLIKISSENERGFSITLLSH